MQKIERVGILDAGFQQVPLVQNFWNFYNIVMEHQWFKISAEMQKIISIKIFPKNIHFTT